MFLPIIGYSSGQNSNITLEITPASTFVSYIHKQYIHAVKIFVIGAVREKVKCKTAL